MKGYNELVVCDVCKAVMGFSGNTGMSARCSRCGAAALGVMFLPQDGSLIVWDEESEKISLKNNFLQRIIGVVRGFVG